MGRNPDLDAAGRVLELEGYWWRREQDLQVTGAKEEGWEEGREEEDDKESYIGVRCVGVEQLGQLGQ